MKKLKSHIKNGAISAGLYSQERVGLVSGHLRSLFIFFFHGYPVIFLPF
jgi:hypothetical protein